VFLLLVCKRLPLIELSNRAKVKELKKSLAEPGKSIKGQLLLEKFGFFFVEIGNDAVDMQVDDGLATLGGEEEGAVLLVVH
jgi:hypothetical protein